MRKQWKQWQTLFSWAPKSVQMVTAAMKLGHLLVERKTMTNLDSILKSWDITLPTKVRLVKAMVFPVIMYGCESWTFRKLKTVFPALQVNSLPLSHQGSIVIQYLYRLYSKQIYYKILTIFPCCTLHAYKLFILYIIVCVWLRTVVMSGEEGG